MAQAVTATGSVGLTDLLAPRRPSWRFVGVIAITTALVISFFGPDLDHRSEAPHHVLNWILANLAAAIAVTVIVAFVAPSIPDRLLRKRASGLAMIVLLFGLAGTVGALERSHIDGWMEGASSNRTEFSNVASGAVMFVLIGLVANAYLAMRDKLNDQHQLLEEQVEELRRARGMLVVADEKFRRDIAEELHGRVQTRLVAAELMLARAINLIGPEAHAAGSVLANALDVIGDVRDRDVRGLSHRLHPSAIRVVLLPALRNLLASHEETTGVPASLRVDQSVARLDDPGDRRLHETVALIVYRTVEEAFANSQRHGRATSVEVELSISDDGCLHLVVLDNGIGLPADGVHRGLGITTIEGRVEQRGGTVSLSNRIEGGVRLEITIPIRRLDLGELPAESINGFPMRRRADDWASRPTIDVSGHGASPGRRRRQRTGSVLSR